MTTQPTHTAAVPVSPDRPDRRRTAIAVTAAVVPPIAWLVSLAMSYVIQGFSCAAASSADVAPPEETLHVILIVLNVVLLAVTVAAGIAGLLLARSLMTTGEHTGSRVLVFLGWAAVVLALVFGYGIILIGGGVVVLPACGAS